MDFLLEVGTEELPADFVDSAIAQLQERVSKSLETESLDCDCYSSLRNSAPFARVNHRITEGARGSQARR
ncbi:MAG UNVERIFIED_CONTAM: glycine--tRNA ligase subunit beta [Microcystis novacekii LVE1205-3]|jgi:glycyl-tRNA synthetase beta subunit